jgi:hypothetical protein
MTVGLSQKNASFADYANFHKYYIKVKFYFADNKQNKICENLRNLRNLRSKKLLRQPHGKFAYLRLKQKSLKDVCNTPLQTKPDSQNYENSKQFLKISTISVIYMARFL